MTFIPDPASRATPQPPLASFDQNMIPELKAFLDPVVQQVETPEYIATDPVVFMHRYDDPENRNLAGFLSALFAWGRRDIVIAKTGDLLGRFDTGPADFIGNLTPADESRLHGFKHRTFTAEDIRWILRALSGILRQYGSFEAFWSSCYRESGPQQPLLSRFHHRFFSMIPEAPDRVRKHIATPDKNSSCKRLWLFLRWAIRHDSPVDPGTMSFMTPSELMIPLDVHVARFSRLFGLLTRRANDARSVDQLTATLRMLDPLDPARYDYALFGLGIQPLTIPEMFLVNQNIC